MLAKNWLSTASYSYLFFVVLGFVALWFSPFLVSLSTVLAGLLFLLNWRSFSFGVSPFSILHFSLVAIALLVLIDGALSGFNGVVGAKLVLILGFVFLLLAGFLFFKHVPTKLFFVALIFCAAVAVVNGIAVSNYFVHKAELDALLLQSKSIPIPNMHHIHFGILNAWCAILLVGLLVHNYLPKGVYRTFGIVCLVVVISSTHILSSRTGLVSLYVASAFGAVHYALYHKNYKQILLLFAGLAALSLSAYLLSTSLRNKVANSIEDINSWGVSKEINHKSMAMRVEAYRASSYIIGKNLLGVGANGLTEKMNEGYNQTDSPLWPENRIDPHNQFLEFGVKYGLFGVASLVLFFLGLIRLGRHSSIFLGAVVLTFISMQFESLLERQTSLYFLAVFIPLFFHLFTFFKQNSEISGS